MIELVIELDAAIAGAVERAAHGVEKFGILFSAGLDSSLLAKVCEDSGKSATLYSAALEDSLDWKRIKDARKIFRSEIKFRELSPGEIEEYAEKVMEIISSAHNLHVSIGIPFFAACEEARKDGQKIILMGQGADELFAGYNRYLRMEPRELEGVLVEDFEKLKAVDYKRDLSIAGANGLGLRLPYVDEEVVKKALQIPVELKIKNGTRKYILREVAKKRGLPESIYAADKKAVQFSSGVDKALRRIARMKGKTLNEYLRESYEQVFK